MQELIEQVLDITRLDLKKMDLDFQKIEVVGFIKLITESFESLAESNGISLSTHLPDKKIYVALDKDKVQKIMVNLLSNALKFTANGGEVAVTLHTNESMFFIQVKDTGKGISEENLPLIFDRFHSDGRGFSNKETGLGVGLNLTQQFVELLEGNITVKSQEGKGALFTVALPIKAELFQKLQLPEEEEDKITLTDHETDTQKSLILGKHTAHEVRVLLVEDNPDMRSYVSELLVNQKIQVLEAENGMEAKKILALTKPDLIISDIMMSGMDGFEFAEYIRSVPEFRFIPLIVLSALSGEDERIQAFDIGVSDYLIKPFNARELKARVANLLKLKFEREQARQEFHEKAEEISENALLVKKLKAFVMEHVSESNISVEELCSVVNLSRSQLYRNLKAVTGFTPAEFVKEVKLRYARHVLENKKPRTISEAAYAAGFSTPSYFTKLYRERFGQHPRDHL